MTRTIRAAAALVLALQVPAQAQPPRRIVPFVPPVQYDHPYDGTVYVVTTSDTAFLTEACPAGQFKPPLACAFKGPTGCVIVLASNKLFKAQGVSVAVARRHERGHCNNWPSDHPNPRMPKQAGRDVDATLGTRLIDVPDDEFITKFRAERVRMANEQALPKPVKTIWPEPEPSKNISPKSAKTIWPEPDLSKNIWPTK